MTHFCSEPAGAARRRRAEGNKPGVVISSETMFPLGASEKISDLAAAFAAEAEKIKITFTHADESTEYGSFPAPPSSHRDVHAIATAAVQLWR